MKKYILLSLLLASNCFAANPSFTQVTNIVYDMIGDAEDSDFGSMAFRGTNEFLGTNALPANINEFWVSPVGDYPGGNGRSPLTPIVVTNSAQFDELMNPHDPGTGVKFNPYGTAPTNSFTKNPNWWVWPLTWTNSTFPDYSTIHLMAGTYHTVMGFYLRPGWKVIADAGPYATTIRLDNNITSGQYITQLDVVGGQFAYLYIPGKDNITVSGLTVDMNMQNQTNKNVSNYSDFWLVGDNSALVNCRTINWGSTLAGTESFLFHNGGLVGNFYGAIITNGNMHNALIDGCIVGPPAQVLQADGTSAFTIGGGGFCGSVSNGAIANALFPDTLNETNGGWSIGGEVRNCIIESNFTVESTPVDVGSPKYFSCAILGSFTDGLRIHDNNFQGVKNGVAVFGEQGPYRNVMVDHNYVSGMAFGFSDVGYASYISPKSGLIIKDNFFRVASTLNNSTGIRLGGPFETNFINGVVISGNNVGTDTNAPGNMAIALTLTRATNVVVENNVLDAGSNPDAAVYTNTYFQTFFNNRDQAGNYLTFSTATGYTNVLDGLNVQFVRSTNLGVNGNLQLTSLPTNPATGMLGLDGSGNVVANSKIPFDLFPAGVQTNQNGGGLTNLANSTTISSGDNSVVITPTQKATGETNYDLSIPVYSTKLASDFLVNSNWFSNGTGATGYTNSPAFLTVPSGTYLETAVFYLLPITGSDIMGANLVWNQNVTINTIQIFGQQNSAPLVQGGWITSTLETRGNGALLSSEMVTFQGIVKVTSNPSTVYLGGSHVLFTTNSFYVKAGSSLTLQRIGN